MWATSTIIWVKCPDMCVEMETLQEMKTSPVGPLRMLLPTLVHRLLVAMEHSNRIKLIYAFCCIDAGNLVPI